MKAVGQFAGGIAAFDAGKFTRKQMRLNAQGAQEDGVVERDRIREMAREQMGRQLVGQASSGFQIGTGSALDALRESATNRELDILTSRRNAQMKADAFNQKGALAYAQGKSALAGGIISGAATLVETAMSAGAFGGAGGAGGAEAAGGDAGGIVFTGGDYSRGAFGG